MGQNKLQICIDYVKFYATSLIRLFNSHSEMLPLVVWKGHNWDIPQYLLQIDFGWNRNLLKRLYSLNISRDMWRRTLKQFRVNDDCSRKKNPTCTWKRTKKKISAQSKLQKYFIIVWNVFKIKNKDISRTMT